MRTDGPNPTSSWSVLVVASVVPRTIIEQQFAYGAALNLDHLGARDLLFRRRSCVTASIDRAPT
jgi:hypothetical protein